MWIETNKDKYTFDSLTSRPARACGLKHNFVVFNKKVSKSRPARACGLKQLGHKQDADGGIGHAPHGRVD